MIIYAGWGLLAMGCNVSEMYLQIYGEDGDDNDDDDNE